MSVVTYLCRNDTSSPLRADRINNGRVVDVTIKPGETIRVPEDKIPVKTRAHLRSGLLSIVSIEADQHRQVRATGVPVPNDKDTEQSLPRITTRSFEKGELPEVRPGDWTDGVNLLCVMYDYDHGDLDDAVTLPEGVPNGCSLLLVNRSYDPVCRSGLCGFNGAHGSHRYTDPDGQNAGGTVELISVGDNNWVLRGSTRINNRHTH